MVQILRSRIAKAPADESEGSQLSPEDALEWLLTQPEQLQIKEFEKRGSRFFIRLPIFLYIHAPL